METEEKNINSFSYLLILMLRVMAGMEPMLAVTG